MATTNRAFRDGLVVGLIAYAAVAVFYTVFDVLAARGTFYTVNLLGQAVFRGQRDPAVLQFPIPADLTAVFWYNALHLVLSLAIGIVVVRLVDQGQRVPAHARLMLAVIVAGFIVTIVAVGMLTAPIRPLLPWWSIVVANSAAVILAGAYLMRTRPGVWRHLTAAAA